MEWSSSPWPFMACSSSPPTPPVELLERARAAPLESDEASEGVALALFVQEDPPPEPGAWFWVVGAVENRAERSVEITELDAIGEAAWIAAQRFEVEGRRFERRFVNGGNLLGTYSAGPVLVPGDRHVFATRWRILRMSDRPVWIVQYEEPEYDRKNPVQIREMMLSAAGNERRVSIFYWLEGHSTAPGSWAGRIRRGVSVFLDWWR